MQQAPTTTAGSPQPTPAPAPAAQTGIPQTRAELNGLVAKRSELERQLEQLTERRQELFRQRQSMGRQEGQGHDNRIALIDDQTTQIEREVLQLNTAIAQGTATVAASGDEFTATTRPSGRELRNEVRSAVEDAVVGTLFGSAAGMLAIYVVWRGIRRWVWKKKPAPAVAAHAVPDQSPRLEQLQQSVDVIALEVERISEAQRFLAKVLNERVPAIGAGDAQPVSSKNRDAMPERR
jgi:exonuclease VII large subunit